MMLEETETLLAFFKALAHESRLRMVGLLAEQERSVDELATLLALKPPTISHHLARLRGVGLVEVRAEGTTRHYRLVPGRLEALSKEVLAPGTLERATGTIAPRAWEDKVLDTFLDGSRLRSIPSSRKKRSVILDWLVKQFEPGRSYTEVEVNRIVKAHHPDSATLRRELVGAGLMTRERSVYQRVE